MDYVIIVAGGSSRRFGSDKLLTNVGSEPVVRRVLEASSGLGEQVVVTSRPEAERLGAWRAAPGCCSTTRGFRAVGRQGPWPLPSVRWRARAGR